MKPDAIVLEKLRRIIFRELLLEPELHREAGLEKLPAELSKLLGCSASRAIDKLLQDPLLEALDLQQLELLLTIRDMSLVSRTASSLSAELKQPDVTYEQCCRRAICYAVANKASHVYAALRAAASKDDSWARHHYLYGIILATEGNHERALWELDMALRREPYEDARIRIRQVLSLIEG